MDETEFEEGEAYYRDDSSVNPDTDLSYIDEKLQNVLGHFQKDFEGLVTAEGLGAKFGDYGSFLPTYQRHAPILPHPNNPKNVQNLNTRETPKVSVEGAPKDAGQSTRLGIPPRSLPPSNNAVPMSVVTSEGKGSKSLSTAQNKKPLAKEEPVLNKQPNSSDRRSLKVRIKLKSDKAAKNKNAAIFTSFGLNTTPSSSLGNSEDSSGMPSQCAGTQVESPSHILQMMTSFPVPGGSPLSPLIKSLLCLEMNEKHTHIINPMPNRKLSKDKKKKVVEKRKDKVIPNEEIGDKRTNLVKAEVSNKVTHIENETLGQGLMFKNPLSGKVRKTMDNKKGAEMVPQISMEAERNESRNNKEFSKVTVEEMLSPGLGLEDPLELISDHNAINFEKGDLRSSSIERTSESRSKNYCKDESVDFTRNVQSKKNESNSTVKTDSEQMEKSSSKGKKKTRSQNSADLASEAEGSLISGSYEVAKGKKSSSKVCNLKSHDLKIQKSLQPETTEQVTNYKNHFADRPSASEASKKQGASLNKLREISTQKDTSAHLIPDSSLKESANDGDLSRGRGLVSEVAPTPAEHVMIEEDWVQCERCDKWRLLPYGTKPEQLPEKWVCRMLNWLPGMNRCDFSEDDTTQALRRLYQPENQNNLTNDGDRNVPGASSAGVVNFGMDQFNQRSNRMVNPQKMKKKATSSGGTAQISGSVKNFELDVVKNRSLSNTNQKSVENKAHQYEENNEKFGTKEKKLKSKRAAEQYEHETPKRARVDPPSGVVKITKSIPSSAMLDGESLQPESSEMKPYGETEISLKKRKLKDWQESQNHTGGSKDDGDHLNERKDFKEAASDNELRKVKKSMISSVDRREPVSHKASERRSIGKVMKLKNPVHEQKKGSPSSGVDMMNRRSEQFPRPATSSSSKVSDSLRKRSNFPDVKGSPVESVSSSPIRASNFEQPLPAGRDNLRKSASNNGHIPMADSSKKSLNLEGHTEIKQSGLARRQKVSAASQLESPNFSALDFRDNNNGQKSVGKSRARDDSKNLEKPCPGDLQLRNRSDNDDKSNKNLDKDNALFQEKVRKGSSQLSKGKNVISGSNPERIKKLPTQISEKLPSLKMSLKDGAKTGPNNVALPIVETKDLKCRIKLVKDDRNDKLVREATQRDPIQGANDGVETRSDLTRIEGSSSLMVSNHVPKKVPQDQTPSSIPRLHKGNASDVALADSSGSGDSLKVLKQSNHAPSPLRNDASSQSSAAFRKAEELKSCGDRFKESGFPIEGNEAYFQAAWHFLQAASLREGCTYDSNKHGEMSPMQIYNSTAKLCELCANEYEKQNDLAAAALAYKCVEVAYMRVVYCKNTTLTRDRLDLQASLQIVPQGESPSSSASDVDSINNQVMLDKATLPKTIGAGNHVIAARNRPNFVRLLDFTKDVNSAMEASCKSQTTFAAATNKYAQNSEGIISVKRVIDVSFQDVDELVRLVRAATDSITRQGFRGNIDQSN